MKIEVGPGGKLNLDVQQQQKWRKHGSTMQTSLFAGQQMMVIQKSDDEPEIYELHYLGFRSEGTTGMDRAIATAPVFAREVLAHMASMIAD
jgi:hypothetical protein